VKSNYKISLQFFQYGMSIEIKIFLFGFGLIF